MTSLNIHAFSIYPEMEQIWLKFTKIVRQIF